MGKISASTFFPAHWDLDQTLEMSSVRGRSSRQNVDCRTVPGTSYRSVGMVSVFYESEAATCLEVHSINRKCNEFGTFTRDLTALLAITDVMIKRVFITDCLTDFRYSPFLTAVN